MKSIMYSGKFVDIFNINIDDIDINDISYGLSNIARFSGQVPFYSVAKHSIYVANQLPKELKLSGLLHDAAEAYIGDVIRPIKEKMNEYILLENKILNKIKEKWNLDLDNDLVKLADEKALEFEKKTIFFQKYYRTEDQKEIIYNFMEIFNSCF